MSRHVSIKIFITVLVTVFTLNEIVNFSKSLILKLHPKSDLDASIDTVRRLKTDINDIRALLGTLSHKIGELPNTKDTQSSKWNEISVHGMNKSNHGKQVLFASLYLMIFIVGCSKVV